MERVYVMIKKDSLHVAVIMAGGVGERFWPLSRRNRPKQLLPLNDPDKSMLQEAVERAAALTGNENVYIITGRHLVAPITEAKLSLPKENILAEPCKRNTTGALAYTAAHLLAKHQDMAPERICMATLTADHRIGNLEAFLQATQTAMQVADSEAALVTCGITPTEPATGFGYIETEPDTRCMLDAPVYQVRAFHEKPDADRAREFLASKRFFWNSGMFFWRLSTFLDEMAHAQPDVAKAIHAMAAALRTNDLGAAEECFGKLDDISIDYALMEHARTIKVVEGDFPWEDVGSWTALRREDTVDTEGNYTRGNPVVLDCKNSIIVNEAGAEKMAVGVLGLSGVTVVVTDDAVLVVDSARAQEVRRVVDALKQRNSNRI